MKTEVRCCCDAGTLLGWIDVPIEGKPLNHRFVFPLDQNSHVELVLGTIYDAKIELDEYGMEHMYSVEWLALTSNHLPIELLRRIRGFEENVLP